MSRLSISGIMAALMLSLLWLSATNWAIAQTSVSPPGKQASPQPSSTNPPSPEEDKGNSLFPTLWSRFLRAPVEEFEATGVGLWAKGDKETWGGNHCRAFG